MRSFAYRPDIDGLRALSVLAVCLYHLDAFLLPGGFVGVDLFFAISGYLITGLLLSQPSDKFSLLTFFQRRIARIFPSLAAVSFATIAASLAIYGSQDISSAGANFAATLLSISNLKQMMQGNYFDLSEDTQPFMHCWSLSVEEQFYLLLPLLMISLRRLDKMVIAILLGVIAALSFAACVWLTAARPTWAFYLLPTRAWELLAGCVLACFLTFFPKPAVRSGFTSAVGMLAILMAFTITPDGETFPGLWPLVPVFGALCILKPGGNDPIRKALAMPLLTNIGRMSYSIYLCHWPVFSFVDYRWCFM